MVCNSCLLPGCNWPLEHGAGEETLQRGSGGMAVSHLLARRLWLSGVAPCLLSSCPQDFEGGSLYGLEKFWAFHHYTGFPKDQPNLEMLPKVSCLEWRARQFSDGSPRCCVILLSNCMLLHTACTGQHNMHGTHSFTNAPGTAADAIIPC